MMPTWRAALVRHSGLFGALLVTLGALVVEKVPVVGVATALRPLRALDSGPIQHGIWLAVTVLGIALVCHAWLRELLGPAHQRSTVRGIRRRVAAWSVPLLIAPPAFSHDGWSYVAQGVLTAEGIDPYQHGPAVLPGAMTDTVDEAWYHTPAPYGPLPLIFGAGIAHVTDDPYLAVLAFRLPVLLALVLLAWALPPLAVLMRMDPDRLSALVLMCPLVIIHGVAGMHSDILVAALGAVAFVLAARGQLAVAACCVGLGASIKITAGVMLVACVLVALPRHVENWRRVLTFAWAGVLSIAVVAACGVPYGLGFGWLGALDVPGRIVSATAPVTAVGMALRELMVGSPAAANVVAMTRTVGMVAAVAICAVVALRAKTGGVAEASRAGAWCLGALVLLGPVFHGWYVLLLLPVAPAIVRMRHGWPWASMTCIALSLIAPINSSLHGAPLLIAEAVALAFVASAAAGTKVLSGAREIGEVPGMNV